MIIYQGQQCMSILINLFMHFFIHLERIFCVRATMDTFHRRTGLGFVRVFTLIINKKSCNNVNLTLLICIKVNIQRKNYKWIPSSSFFKFQMTQWLKSKTFLLFSFNESITRFLKKSNQRVSWGNDKIHNHTHVYYNLSLMLQALQIQF